MTKICTICQIEKSLIDFAKHSSTKDGKNSYCKECMREYSKKYRKENKEKITQYIQKNINRIKQCNQKRFATKYKNDDYRESHLIKNAKWREQNTNVYKESQSKWRKANPIKMACFSALHRAKRKQATPNWLSEWDYFVFEEAFSLRKLRFKATGFLWEVDHIIPISGKTVCGLHVWNNLQVIPATINRSKFNKYE